MRLRVKVKPNARRSSARTLGENEFEVSVRAKPVEGKANAAVLKALAEHLGIAASRLRLLAGGRGRIKFFELK